MCLYLQNLYVLLCTNYVIYVLCSPNYENETCVITCYSNVWGWILFVLMISHMHTFRWRLWSSSSPSGPAPQLCPTTMVQPIQSPVRIPVALLINILHPQFHACNYGIWFGTRHDHKRLVHMYACIMYDILALHQKDYYFCCTFCRQPGSYPTLMDGRKGRRMPGDVHFSRHGRGTFGRMQFF